MPLLSPVAASELATEPAPAFERSVERDFDPEAPTTQWRRPPPPIDAMALAQLFADSDACGTHRRREIESLCRFVDRYLHTRGRAGDWSRLEPEVLDLLDAPLGARGPFSRGSIDEQWALLARLLLWLGERGDLPSPVADTHYLALRRIAMRRRGVARALGLVR